MSDALPVRRIVIKHETPSRHLAEGSRLSRIYLPPGYAETISYPVVYCQDGEDFFNFGRIATIAQRLILEESWDPFIVVGVDVDKTFRTLEYKPDEPRHESYVRFFAEELVPDIERCFPVRRTPEERLLAGCSLGAAVSLSLAVTRPDLFTRVLSFSGAFYPVSREQIQSCGDLSALSVWMTVGLQETAFETDRGVFDFVALNRAMRECLEAKGAAVIYSEKDGEHKWGFWQRELPEGLAAFLGPTRRF